MKGSVLRYEEKIFRELYFLFVFGYVSALVHPSLPRKVKKMKLELLSELQCLLSDCFQTYLVQAQLYLERVVRREKDQTCKPSDFDVLEGEEEVDDHILFLL